MKTYIIFKGTVKQLEEFSLHLKSYPKNTTVAKYIEEEMKK